jgi:hypothetical protein
MFKDLPKPVALKLASVKAFGGGGHRQDLSLGVNYSANGSTHFAAGGRATGDDSGDSVAAPLVGC